MTDNLTLKNIIEAKLKNPYTENKTIDQLRKETEDAGNKIPLPKHTKFKRVSVGNIDAEWITCGEFESDKILCLCMVGDIIEVQLLQLVQP